MTRALNVGIIVADPNLRHTIVDCLNHLKVRIAFAVSPTGADTSAPEYSNPEVLVLDFGHRSAFEIMTTLKTMPSPPPVIAAHVSADPDVILAAVRAGAREFVSPPISSQTFQGALDKIASERLLQAPANRAGKTIGLLSAQGGCGATLVACHLAAELRRITTASVLAADFDPTSGMLGFWLRANPSRSVLDVAKSLTRMDLSLWKGMVHTVQPRLDALTAPADIPLGELPSSHSFSTVLRFGRANYDWVVADLGQGLSPLSMALIPELDTLYVVTTPEVAALYQARRAIQKLVSSQLTAEPPRMVVNRVRVEHAPDTKDMERLLSGPVEAYLPEDYDAVVDAHSEGRLVSPGSDLGRRLAQLAFKVSGQPAPERRESRFSLFRQFRARAAEL